MVGIGVIGLVVALTLTWAVLPRNAGDSRTGADVVRPLSPSPSSSPERDCISAPGRCGFPDADTTGVRPGAKLEVVMGDVYTTQDGQTIDSLDIYGTLYIDNSRVTVTNTKVTGAGGYSWAIWVGRDRPVKGVVIRDCTVDANRSDQGGVVSGLSSSWSMYRCDISNGENAVRPGGNARIQDNYFHDFASSSAAPHFDAVEVYSGSGTQIVHNTMVLNQPETSVVNVQATFGAVSGTVVDRNLIQGGGWQLNIRDLDGPVAGTEITDNRFGDDFQWGYAAVDQGTASVISGNVRDRTGVSIDGQL